MLESHSVLSTRGILGNTRSLSALPARSAQAGAFPKSGIASRSPFFRAD